jgi:hypothetical protein
VCARVCVCVRVRGQRWPPAGASCSRARVRSSQALARSYPPTHLREASTRSRESQKGVRLRAHAPTDLGTQSAGPTQRAIIAADAAGPAALQSHRTGTVNGVPCGHAPAGRAGWSVCGKRASRGNLAIVRRPVGAAKRREKKSPAKKHSGDAQARWVCSWSHVCAPLIDILFPNARYLWANLSSGGNRPREPVDAFGAQGQDRGVASTSMDPILPCSRAFGWRAHRVPLCKEIVDGYRARRRLPLPGANSPKSPLIVMSFSQCA